MESQPQNPELINNPENFHPCFYMPSDAFQDHSMLTHLKRVPVLLVSPLKGPVVYSVRQVVAVWLVGQVTPVAVLVVPVGSRVTPGILD